jgi:hypothetical protein
MDVRGGMFWRLVAWGLVMLCCLSLLVQMIVLGWHWLVG